MFEMKILFLKTDLPNDLQKELKQLYASLSEILRHFWAAFPPSTPQLAEKANRMIDALHRFNQVKCFKELIKNS